MAAYHDGTGKTEIDVQNSTVTTSGAGSSGIYATHSTSASDSVSGDIIIDVQGSTITTTNTDDDTQSHGIHAKHEAYGNVKIDVQGGSITTSGSPSHGIYAEHSGFGPGAPQLDGNLDIEADGVSITTGGDNSHGIYSQHTTTGNLSTDVRNSKITTTGYRARGIYSRQPGDGDSAISLTNTQISTSGNQAYGVYGLIYDSTDSASAASNLRIQATGGTITTQGTQAHGIYGYARGSTDTATADTLEIELNNVVIKTESTAHVSTTDDYTFSTGIYGRHYGTGDLDINARGGSVATKGKFSYGIYARHYGSGDNITVRTQNGHSISTTGEAAHGIVAIHYGTHNTRAILIDIDGSSITTTGDRAIGVRVGTASGGGVIEHTTALDAEGYRMQTVNVNGRIQSAGAGLSLAGGGRVTIGPQGSIRSDSGIAILATGDVAANPVIKPKLRVDLNPGGRRMSQVLGDDWIINDGGETTIAMNNIVLHDGSTGVTGMTAPNGAWDVRMLAGGVRVTNRTTTPWTMTDRAEAVVADRDFSAQDFTEARRPAEMHQVDEAVSVGPDAMAGVHIVGDGEVHIGAQGSIEAASGIAILATDPSGEPPALLVDMDLDGRRVSQVIGDNWIINDGGGTTLVVNGVTLHDGTTGVVPGAVAPNGAFNVQFETAGGLQAQAGGVRIREEGVRVLDRTGPDPANWVISDPAVGVIADRDFSVADFIETETRPMFMEEYAPRAALYEALPDMLLRLQHRAAVRAPRLRPERSQWIRVMGRTGSQDFKRSTVGSEYDMDYVEVEAGKHVLLDNGLDAWAALHYLDGTADVSSPVRGGDIDVRGLGLSVEVCRGCDDGDWYASGRLALSRYDLDLTSDTRGRLRSGVNATAWGLRLEAGRRLQRWNMQLTPRIRLEHADVSVDRFTDAVAARVSYSDEDRSAVALGVMVEPASPATGSGPSLWGSLDFEHRLGDGQTTAQVSGERLTARPETDSLLLGAGGTWRRDDLEIHAGLSVREELGSGGEEYGATFSLDLQF